MKNFLPRLIATITGHPRYRPDFEWSDNCWTHNFFRALGVVFGERYGVRPSVASGRDENGRPWQVAYTLEAQIAIFERALRAWFARQFAFKIVLVPKMQLAGMAHMGITPYMFAIAFDAASGTSNNNTPLPHTCTGSNLFLHVIEIGDLTTDTLTGITYNSVAMTAIDKIQFPSDRWTYSYGLVNPSTGANSIAPSGTTFNECGGMSYTGCKQSGQPDSHATTSATNSTATWSTTVVASNCWLSGFVYGGTWSSEGTGTTGRSITGHRMHDSNGTVGTGSQSLQVNFSASSQFVAIAISIAPPAAAVNSSFLAFM